MTEDINLKPQRQTFNNGFIIALVLFLEHKNDERMKTKDMDTRLYGAADHLFDMEIPALLHTKLRDRVLKLKSNVMKYRLEPHNNNNIIDDLFKEAEDILIEIDKYYFRVEANDITYR